MSDAKEPKEPKEPKESKESKEAKEHRETGVGPGRRKTVRKGMFSKDCKYSKLLLFTE
jgi:hypothetical protein